MDPIGTRNNPHVHVDHPEADALTAKLVALARRGKAVAGAALVIAGLAVIPASTQDGALKMRHDVDCPTIMRHDGRC